MIEHLYRILVTLTGLRLVLRSCLAVMVFARLCENLWTFGLHMCGSCRTVFIECFSYANFELNDSDSKVVRFQKCGEFGERIVAVRWVL